MKKYKRTRILASVAIISSLAWSSSAFAASPVPVKNGWSERGAHVRGISEAKAVNSAEVTVKTRGKRGSKKALKQAGQTE